MESSTTTTDNESEPRASMQAWALAIGAAAMPLAAWPALAEPFDTPKRFVLRLTAVAVVACWLASPSRLRQLPHSAALLVMPLLLLVAMGWARGIPGSDGVTLDLLATSVIAMGAATVGQRGRTIVCAGLVVGAAVLSLVTCLQFLGVDVVAAAGGAVDWRQYADKMRMYGTMGNPNMVALVAAASMPIAVGLCAVSTTRRGRWLAAAAAVVMAAAVFVTFSKAAMGASLVAVVLLWLWAERCQRWTWRRRAVLVVAVAMVVTAFVLTVPHYSRGQNRPDQTVSRPWSEAAGGRITLWRTGLAAAAQSPVWGLGPTGLSRSFAADGLRARHVHNDYLELFADGGVLVSVWAAVALGALVVAGRQRRRQMSAADTPLHDALATSLLVVAMVAVVDFPMQRPAERALALIIAGLLIAPATVSVSLQPVRRPWIARAQAALAMALVACGFTLLSRMLVADRLLWRAEGLEYYSHDAQADAAYRRAAQYGADAFRVHQGLGRLALKHEHFHIALSHAQAAYHVFPDPAAAALVRRAQRHVLTSPDHSPHVNSVEEQP